MGFESAMGKIAKLAWPGAKFAGEAHWRGDRWWMVANGPGEALVLEALEGKEERGWDHQYGIMRGARSGAARGRHRGVRRRAVDDRQAAVRARARFTRSIMWPSPPREKRTLRNADRRDRRRYGSGRGRSESRGMGCFHSCAFARFPTGRATPCRWISIAIATRAGISRGRGLRWRPWRGPSP